jgi:hypothetical protein
MEGRVWKVLRGCVPWKGNSPSPPPSLSLCLSARRSCTHKCDLHEERNCWPRTAQTLVKLSDYHPTHSHRPTPILTRVSQAACLLEVPYFIILYAGLFLLPPIRAVSPTVPQCLPTQLLQRVPSSSSSSKLKYLLFALTSSSGC